MQGIDHPQLLSIHDLGTTGGVGSSSMHIMLRSCSVAALTNSLASVNLDRELPGEPFEIRTVDADAYAEARYFTNTSVEIFTSFDIKRSFRIQ